MKTSTITTNNITTALKVAPFVIGSLAANAQDYKVKKLGNETQFVYYQEAPGTFKVIDMMVAKDGKKKELKALQDALSKNDYKAAFASMPEAVRTYELRPEFHVKFHNEHTRANEPEYFQKHNIPFDTLDRWEPLDIHSQEAEHLHELYDHLGKDAKHGVREDFIFEKMKNGVYVFVPTQETLGYLYTHDSAAQAADPKTLLLGKFKEDLQTQLVTDSVGFMGTIDSYVDETIAQQNVPASRISTERYNMKKNLTEMLGSNQRNFLFETLANYKLGKVSQKELNEARFNAYAQKTLSELKKGNFDSVDSYINHPDEMISNETKAVREFERYVPTYHVKPSESLHAFDNNGVEISKMNASRFFRQITGRHGLGRRG